MSGKKGEGKQKLKPITFKFSPKDGGKVTFKGLGVDKVFDEYELIPEAIIDVLRRYGLDVTEHWHVAVDTIGPCNDFNFEEMLQYIAQVASVSIETEYQEARKGGERQTLFAITIDEADTDTDTDLVGALIGAFALWNKHERTIDGVSVVTALETVVNTINKERVNG